MIDLDVLFKKVNSIQRWLQRIRSKTEDKNSLLHDLDVQDIVVVNLQRAVQTAIDLAAHVVAGKRLGIPNTLKETFEILENNSLLSKDVALQMTKMVGFRNIAVHDYRGIDPAILVAIVDKHLGDLEIFYDMLLSRCSILDF